MAITGKADPGRVIGFLPLYRQVKERLVRRIADGEWQAGRAIPSEMQIAAELGVSQGTVRKALDEMTAERLLVRRQGVGTFVASHDEDRILFQFFKLSRDDGRRVFPDSTVLSVGEERCDADAALRLGLRRGTRVVRIHRLRSLGGDIAVSESIIVPSARFAGLAACDPVPNNLYGLYAERYGVTIARASESLKAVPCPPADAPHLGLAAGSPVLAIDRLALDLDGQRVEWRVSLCRTDQFHYTSDLK
ncbi:GntR family transcriptional regulator [Phreatobacter sp.]|uniref:GntR family transcriptional regulator n=1 Tax=Phreatobacter sp. TaxID=1966341 RepID=UPI0022BAFF24|nr:GntR family transcriptional regulator [Phreatobacter sp.]MCZ8313669.1 GntR family transcriptional regulator [Phreatobacter sp.]